MRDYTTKAVINQLRAMACQSYEIGIFDREKGEMFNRSCLSNEEIIKMIPWLKSENYKGNDIYIRPDENENRALILVDDINKMMIEQMIKRGMNPACIIETSPNNFQVWVSLVREPISNSQHKIASQLLQKEFNGDKASVGFKHYGRLSGFTNRKTKYIQDNKYPYVLCRDSSGQHANNSRKLREWTKRKDTELNQVSAPNKLCYEGDTEWPVSSKNTSQSSPDHVQGTKGLEDSKSPIETFKGQIEAIPKQDQDAEVTFQAYFKQWQKVTNMAQKAQDYSIGDFSVACRMIKEGYSKIDIINSIIENSPNINERKHGHINNYAERTFEAALNRCISDKNI